MFIVFMLIKILSGTKFQISFFLNNEMILLPGDTISIISTFKYFL